MAKAIRPIRTDFCVKDRAVRAAFKAADVRAGKREVRSKFLGWRRHVNEILQPVVDDLHFWPSALNYRLPAGKNLRAEARPLQEQTNDSGHHGNCVRKRTSFRKKTWISWIVYRSMARRS